MAKKKGLHITKEQLEEIIGMNGDILGIECINKVNGQYRYTIENSDGTFNMNVFLEKTILLHVMCKEQIEKNI